MRITVNGRVVALVIDVVTYSSVARLAYPSLVEVPDDLTISYQGVARSKASQKPEGTLKPGNWVQVEDGAIFNVVMTGGA